MLRTLRIRDLVIVEDLTVEFGPGLNLLTGETGAGKSILVDALGLLVGLRAERSLIRAGQPKAVVEALFEVDDSANFREWAAERGIELADGGELLVQRELAAQGHGRVRVNGSPCTVSLLRELGEWVVELHGQHEQHSLLALERQSDLVDEYGGHGDLLAETRRAWDSVRMAGQRLDELRQRAAASAQRVEQLERTEREIAAAAPRPGEIEELDRERQLLQNAARVARLLEDVVEQTYEGEPSSAGLAALAAARAEELARLDPGLEAPAAQIRAAALELQDAGAAFRDYRDRRDFDPRRLEELVERHVALERLCLRHGADEAGLLERLAQARRELSDLAGLDGELEATEAARIAAERRYVEAAAALTRARRAAADGLSRAVLAQLRVLALPGAAFEVAFRPARAATVTADSGEPVPLGPQGAERAEFLLSANPGEPVSALSQAASGGELSRIMLALHVVAEDGGGGRALVFDEVDAGVGGAVADAVGARLAELARRQQVLCVTHLPQVAAYADRHFRVHKRLREGRTLATVEDLTRDSRVEELARMLAGKYPTEASRRHAAELLGAAGRLEPRRRA